MEREAKSSNRSRQTKPFHAWVCIAPLPVNKQRHSDVIEDHCVDDMDRQIY
jgi:hypothetical protein